MRLKYEFCILFLQLSGFGPALLSNVDPNPDNFVFVGILHTTAAQIGCLARLEPNIEAKVGKFSMDLTSMMSFRCIGLLYELPRSRSRPFFPVCS